MGNVKASSVRLRSYAVAHLGEQCRTVSDLVDMIQEYKIHPERNQDGSFPGGNIQGELERLTALLDDEILYLGRVLDDMRSAAILAKRKGRT